MSVEPFRYFIIIFNVNRESWMDVILFVWALSALAENIQSVNGRLTQIIARRPSTIPTIHYPMVVNNFYGHR